MTFPMQFHFGHYGVHAHEILELAAYAAGFQLYLFLRRRWKRTMTLTAEQTGWIIVGAIFGALFGAKSLAWAESLPWYWAHHHDWHILIGGKTIVGALLGGWMGVELAKRRMGLRDSSGDVYVFPLILGMCIGRVGCFLEGLPDHTYGIATTLPWGVDFGDGIRRHPTQLYEIVFLLALACVFIWRIRTRRQRGCMFSQFLFGYLAWRLSVEFIKPRMTLLFVSLSPIQIASLGGMVYGLFHWNDQCCGTTVGAGHGQVVALPESTQFEELTNSLCPTCLAKIEAKVLIEGRNVFLQKFCPQHGLQRVLIADDADYWRRCRSIRKPPTSPRRRNTQMRQGCPRDCGLCPDHEQHSCLAIVEVTQRCDMACPICYASCTGGGKDLPLDRIEAMFDSVVANEGQVNVVQISGGEPTLHPDILAILDAARKRPIRHLMLNTNGRRIAEDADFVRRLAGYLPGFEAYLQFDSLRPQTLQRLRGQDTSDIHRRALEALNARGISTTLVVTLAKGVNDQEIGAILDYAIAQPCVRGVTFQPVQAAGRLGNFDAGVNRLTLSEVRREILRQHSLFKAQDLVPVPCHADALAMAYAIRRRGRLVPLSTLVDPVELLNMAGNTICCEQDSDLRQHVDNLFSASASPSSAANSINGVCGTSLTSLSSSLRTLPEGSGEGSADAGIGPIKYDSVFRVIIMQFMDAWSMDLRSLKRSCVHIVHPDGRLIPFDTYNVLYRDTIPLAEE